MTNKVSLRTASKWIFPRLLSVLLIASPMAVMAQAPIPFLEGKASIDAQPIQEDLLQLSIRASSLRPMPVIPGGSAETADFTRELFQMQWRDNDPIDVYVILPKGVTRPPVSIYLYGYPADADRFRNDAFCRIVTRGGVAAIGFMPALTGQRYHGLPMRTWFVSDLHDSFVKTVHDVQMIDDYISSRSDLDASHIGIFGQGAGATIAGLAATVDPRIEAVDLLDPWGDWPVWAAKSQLIPDAERPDFLTPEYLDSLASLDPVRWLPTLAGRALKLDDALFETGTPAEAKSRIEAALPASGLLLRYPTKADFENQAISDGQLVSWMQQQLLRKPTRPSIKTVDVTSHNAAGAGSSTQAHGRN